MDPDLFPQLDHALEKGASWISVIHHTKQDIT